MSFKVDLIGADDLLNLQIEGRNLIFDPSDPDNPALIPEDGSQVAYLIVHFPSQSIAEEAVYESQKEIEDDDENRLSTETIQENRRRISSSTFEHNVPTSRYERLARTRIGQPSRLVFKIPANSNLRIPYSIEGLLNWTTLELSVSLLADIPDRPAKDQPISAPPCNTETAIENFIASFCRQIVSLYGNTPLSRIAIWGAQSYGINLQMNFGTVRCEILPLF